MSTLSGLMIRIFLLPYVSMLILCFTTQAETGIKPKGSRFAGSLPTIQSELSRFGFDLKPKSLETALVHTDPHVRRQALMALSVLGSPQQVPAMKKLVLDPDNMTRAIAIYALDGLRLRLSDDVSGVSRVDLTVSARLILADAQSDSKTFMRKTNSIFAAKMLLDVADDPSGYPVVLEALTGPEKSMRAYACTAAQLFAVRGVRDKDGKLVDWITPFAAIVRDESVAEVVRIGTVTALMDLASPQARAALIELSKTVENTRLRKVIKAQLARPSVGAKTQTLPVVQ